MAKKQLATTLQEETIKKLKMIALEYDLNVNDVIEVIMESFDSNDVDGKFNQLLQISKLRGK